VTDNKSVPDDTSSIDERVYEALAGILRGAQLRLTDASLEAISGVKASSIKAYRLKQRKASLAAGLAITAALGDWAINQLLHVIQYQARPLDESDELQPTQIVAEAMGHLGVIARAAVDNRIDHLERPRTMEAADHLIATVVPLSSAGRAA
jgi:hypothetical protein